MIKFFKPIVEKNKITYPIHFIDQTVKITHEYLTKEQFQLNTNIEAIIAPYVSIAICNRIPIVSEEPIDKLFYDNLMKMPAIYHKHCEDLSKLNGGVFSLKIDAPVIKKTPKIESTRCATAMSGGVDCIYTLIKKQDQITDLFYVIGYDIDECKLNQKWIKEVVNLNTKIANKFNKNLIICRSNLLCHIKELSKKYYGSSWAIYTVGGGIASIIYPLNFNKLLISGDGTGIDKHKTSYICGLFYDNLYTSNILKVEHYDIVTRWEKVHAIAKYDPTLLANLRFCIKYTDKDGLNCGKCVKCVRTYIMLYLLGLGKYVEIKGVNDVNYLTWIDDFLKETSWSCFCPQIRHLLNNYDPITKTTHIDDPPKPVKKPIVKKTKIKKNVPTKNPTIIKENKVLIPIVKTKY